MKRFSFTTGTVPATSGDGVVWDDGLCAYRQQVGGTRTKAIAGVQQTDIIDKYSAQSGYSLTTVDLADTANPLGYVDLLVVVSGLQVTISFTAIQGAAVTVNWGDSNTGSGTVGTTRFSINHTYAAGGTNSVVMGLAIGGMTASFTVPVVVA